LEAFKKLIQAIYKFRNGLHSFQHLHPEYENGPPKILQRVTYKWFYLAIARAERKNSSSRNIGELKATCGDRLGTRIFIISNFGI